MNLISDCINTEIATAICREEEGKIICFRHDKYEIVCDVVQVEKCVFKNVQGGKRCDFLFMFNKAKQVYNFLKDGVSPAYYVELKGIGLVDACEQLLNSIKLTKDQIVDFDINPLIVSSRKFVPKYDNNEYYRALKRLIKKDIQFEITPYTVSF